MLLKRPYYIWIVTASSAQGPKNNYVSRTYKLLGPWAEARGQKTLIWLSYIIFL